jgi:hypothetical protein
VSHTAHSCRRSHVIPEAHLPEPGVDGRRPADGGHAGRPAANPGTSASAAQKLPSLNWPRNFDAAGEHVELYQPEIEKWDGTDCRGGRGGHWREGRHTHLRRGPVLGAGRYRQAIGLVQLTQIQIDSVDVPTRPDAADKVRRR